VVEHLVAFVALEQDRDRSALLRLFDVVEAEAPEPAVVRQAGGRDEVEVVLLSRVPRAVLDALEPEDALIDRRLLELLGGGESGDIAVRPELHQREAPRTDEGRAAEPEVVSLAGQSRVATVGDYLEPVELPVVEPCRVHGMPVTLLGADVHVDLAR